MFRDVNVLKLLPDRPGRGGTKFGYHSFQQEPINDTRDVKGVHVWQDSWRSDFQGYGTFAGNNFPDDYTRDRYTESAVALHGYSKFSLTDPSVGPDTHILGHNSCTRGGTPGGYVWDYTNLTYYYVDPGDASAYSSNIVCAASTAHPAVFTNINNRCFIATGISEGQIYDVSTGPTVAWASGPIPQTYSIGTSAPTASPVIEPANTISMSACYVRETSKYVSWPDPAGGLFNETEPGGFTGTVESDGITSGAIVKITAATKTTTFSTAGYTVSIANGSDIATFSAAAPSDNAWVGLTLNVNGFSFVMLAFGDAGPAEVPPLAVKTCKLDHAYENGTTGPDDPFGLPGTWDSANDILSAAFTITGVRWDMTVAGPADYPWPGGGVSGANTTQGLIYNTGGALTWDTTPPSYAYAWYDPLTGHISNISPIFSPESLSKDKVGVRVPADNGQISYPPSTSTIPVYIGSPRPSRWTHILFFRTLMAGGSTLYPIGSLDPNSQQWAGLPNTEIPVIPPPGTGNLWKDTARDADLLISGALRAPQFTNNKPRIVQNGVETILWPAHMAYWDGRLWMAATQDPAALHYSCDRVQCPFGIPEESFPDTNVLRIPAADGAVRGMRLIGEQLLVTTERWAYTIAGNNESNYRLVRVSTRMANVGDYQMDEFVSDVEGGGAIVVFVGTDSKVYAMPLGGQAVWISKEIQTTLDAAALYQRSNYSFVRVHCMSIAGRRMALVYVPAATPTTGNTFLYDFDTKVWTRSTFRNSDSYTKDGTGMAFASISNDTTTGVEIYTASGPDVDPPITPTNIISAWSWNNLVWSRPIPSGYVRTFPLTFDGKKTRKQIHFVRIYVNQQPGTTPPYTSWVCNIYKDSGNVAYTASFGDELDDAYKMVGTNSVDTPGAEVGLGAKEQIVTGPQLTGGPPLIGYTFDIQVTFPSYTTKIYQLYRVDVGWTTVSEEDP